jgi:hypothetical protein
MDVRVAEPSLERYGRYVVAEAPRSLAPSREFL